DRRPRVGEREPAGQVLREHQVDAIVNRDYRSRPDQRRKHVMWRVKQRDPLTPERERDANLFVQRVVGRRLRDGPKVFSERRQRLAVGRPAENHVLGLTIESGELPQQVPDIGADAEIMQLAGIYADPHARMISRAGWAGGAVTCSIRGSPVLRGAGY